MKIRNKEPLCENRMFASGHRSTQTSTVLTIAALCTHRVHRKRALLFFSDPWGRNQDNLYYRTIDPSVLFKGSSFKAHLQLCLLKMKRRNVNVFVPGCRRNWAWKMWLHFQWNTELLLFYSFLIQCLTSHLRLSANWEKRLAETSRRNLRKISWQARRREAAESWPRALATAPYVHSLILRGFSELWRVGETQTTRNIKTVFKLNSW